jgi:hypothetical protein
LLLVLLVRPQFVQRNRPKGHKFASFIAEAALVNIGGGGIAMIVGGDDSEEATVAGVVRWR